MNHHVPHKTPFYFAEHVFYEVLVCLRYAVVVFSMTRCHWAHCGGTERTDPPAGAGLGTYTAI
jgi:hypothetical protein